MRTLLIGLLLFSPATLFAQTVEPPLSETPAGTGDVASAESRLKARGQLLDRFNEAIEAEEISQAIEAAEAVVAIERELFEYYVDDSADDNRALAQGAAEQLIDTGRWLRDRYREREELDRAIASQQEVLAIIKELEGESHWKVTDEQLELELLIELAGFSDAHRRKIDQADRLHLEALALFESKNAKSAAEKERAALDAYREVLGEDHSLVAAAQFNLSFLLEQLGEHDESIEHLDGAVKWCRDRLGVDHPDCEAPISHLADLLKHRSDKALANDDFEAARTDLSRRLSLLSDVYGVDGRTADDAASDYRVTDARVALADMERLASLSPEDRKELRRAEELTTQVLELQRTERARDALELAQSAVAIQGRILGEEHPAFAASLNNLALLYYSTGDYVRAEPLYSQSLEINKRVLGEEHPAYATSLDGLGFLYQSMGDYARAEPLYSRSLEIRKRVLGEEHHDYATSLSGLAAFYYLIGDYARAEPLYSRSLEIQKRVLGEEHPEYADTLNNLALLYQSTCDYARAESLYSQSLEIRKRVLGEEHSEYASSLNNLANLYHLMGDYARAEPHFSLSSQIIKRSLGEKHPNYAGSLNNLAVLYGSMGDYARAEPLYSQSCEIIKQSLGEQHPYYAVSLNGLAGVYQSMGDYARAEPLYSHSCEIIKQSLGEEHPYYARSLNSLAGLYEMMGDCARAEPLHSQSLEIRRRVLGEEHPDYADSLNHLALLYGSTGDFTRAEPLFSHSLEIRKRVLGEEHPEYATSLNNLAFFYHSMGDYARAEPLFQRAVDTTLRHLDATALVLSEQQQIAMGRSVRYRLDNYLRCCLEGGQKPAGAVSRAVTWKGSILVRGRGLRLAADDPSIAAEFRTLQSLASQISATTRSVPEPRQIAAWRARLDSLTEQKRKLESALMRRSGDFREANKQVTFEEILASIPENAVLVDYLEYAGKDGPAILATVLRRDGEPVLIDLGSAQRAGEAIDAWRASFGMTSEAKAAGQQLREQIWEPLQEYITESELILVSTDGVLGRFSLAALPGSKPDSYLIEEYRIALIPVPQLLPALVGNARSPRQAHELLLMGDVDYDAQSTSDTSDEAAAEPRRRRRPHERAPLASEVRGDQTWPSLYETRAEVEFIAGLYNRLYEPSEDAVIDLRAASATESAFIKYAPGTMYLHLATHGFFATPQAKSALSSEAIAERGEERAGMFGEQREMIRGHNPGQLSGIVFAGANHPPKIDPLAETSPDDGIMTADEIAFLPLGHVRLVVLSACETGLGEVAGGEGLLGIQRAFQVAGARSTVASLWKVNDAATRRLMQEFYTNYLDKEMSVLDALRETQLWALNNPGDIPRGVARVTTDEAPKRLPPQYWAPFVLSGDWR